MKKLIYSILLSGFIFGLFSCSNDDDSNNTNPTLSGTIVQPMVGGEKQPNQIYIDLSNASQIPVLRSSWNLGFYCGSDFRVVLNPSIEMLAYKTTKTDMQFVNAADTAGLSNTFSTDAIFGALLAPTPPAWLQDAKNWIDNPNGDLDETAIDEISINSADNNVYIINSGKDENGNEGDWYKIKVDQNGNGYKLFVALIDETISVEYNITKDTEYNFTFFSFTNALVNVEPKKSNWHVAFTTYTELANFGFEVPYFYQDFVIQNRNGVEVAEIELNPNENIITSYENFSINDIGSVTFDDAINTIGANWRTVQTPQPGTVNAVKSDRFYIIKDIDNNYYKLVFTDMLSNAGERGHPEFVYKQL